MQRKFECKNCHKVFLSDDQKLVTCPDCHSDNVEYYSIHIPYKIIAAIIAAISIIGVIIFFINRDSNSNSRNDQTITEETDTLASQPPIGEIEDRFKEETGLTIPPSISLQGTKTLNDDDGTYSFKVKIENPPSIPYKVVLADKISDNTIAESKDGGFVGVQPSKAEGGIYLIKLVDTKMDTTICSQSMDGFFPVQKVGSKLSVAELQKLIDSGDDSLIGNGENPYLSPDYTINYKGLSKEDNHPCNLADVLEKLEMEVWRSVKVESVEYDDTKHIKSITLHVTK